MVSGMIFIKKPVMVLSCALLTYSDTLAASFPVARVAGSILRPAPGCNTLATTRPMINAKVEKVMKYSIALPATRPTRFILLIPAIPVTTVKKITGAIIILTNLINASPSGFIASPTSGAKTPSKIPSTMAIITCTYRIWYHLRGLGGSTSVVVSIGIMTDTLLYLTNPKTGIRLHFR